MFDRCGGGWSASRPWPDRKAERPGPQAGRRPSRQSSVVRNESAASAASPSAPGMIRAALSTLDDIDRARLLGQFPDLEYDPHRYGSYARRNLSASEAAILNHAA